METYISDLLYRHDCVIIPGLGSLPITAVHNYPISHTFRPPSKSIRFNVKLQEDDASFLLTNYVSSCESISFASAQSKIERFVFSIQNDLQHKKEARLPKNWCSVCRT